ncbi:tryptophan synthase subunit alpha [Adhaeribacter rhizoryzae]|uniref:Tryptophan synthase alpha chain n=1 Tax=Adhaeribacter rhizoryzae TaxID=2607907 RepID=A0A5M6DF39_9BACT|nr:tryptophan synthase subunit alpha [Adhaeribacter rhizoryzae]KAA5544799.1 tryptophan synthase subunit alpha [Adhaeribacter rhizoryzae]
MENRLVTLFREKRENLLNVYFTAGFPELESTGVVLKTLEAAGADIVEIGMPYSDPLADGPTIQASNTEALRNGMSIRKLFSQLAEVRAQVSLPIILMGYLNPVLQFGIEQFCQEAARVGVDGLILPDMPLHEYEEEYLPLFQKYNLSLIFLVTPQTAEERIRKIDDLTNSFIYLVSSASTTGIKVGGDSKQLQYFQRIQNLNLKNPKLIGFGISDRSSFQLACKYAEGAIIGSAFIKVIQEKENLEQNIRQFIQEVKAPESVSA